MRFRQVLAAAGFSSREPEAISLANALARRRTCVTSLRHPRNIEFFKIAAFVAPAEHHRYEGQRREAQYFTFHKQFPLCPSLLYLPLKRITLPRVSMLV